jgi:hypothetical protein
MAAKQLKGLTGGLKIPGLADTTSVLIRIGH